MRLVFTTSRMLLCSVQQTRQPPDSSTSPQWSLSPSNSPQPAPGAEVGAAKAEHGPGGILDGLTEAVPLRQTARAVVTKALRALGPAGKGHGSRRLILAAMEGYHLVRNRSCNCHDDLVKKRGNHAQCRD